MKEKFLIISKEILPEVYEKVIEARELINNGTVKGITEATKIVGISRSSYYKYKDYVFSIKDKSIGKNASIGLQLRDQKGTLSDILNILSKKNANILTVNQSLPVGGKASVNITIDISEMDKSIEDLISELKLNSGVSGINILSIG